MQGHTGKKTSPKTQKSERQEANHKGRNAKIKEKQKYLKDKIAPQRTKLLWVQHFVYNTCAPPCVGLIFRSHTNIPRQSICSEYFLKGP